MANQKKIRKFKKKIKNKKKIILWVYNFSNLDLINESLEKTKEKYYNR